MKNSPLFFCYFLIVIFPTASYSQNQFEQNNSCSTSAEIELNVEYDAAIQEPFDKDYYVFNVPDEGVLKVQITGISNDYQISSFLFEENCISNFLEFAGSGSNENVILYEKLCTPGTYHLLLEDSGSGNEWSLEPYSFIVTLDTSDIYEANNCNDDCEDAVEIEFGQIVNATIADEFDEDFYKLEVPTEGVITVQITGISDDYGMHSFLYSDVNCINEIEDAFENNASFLNMYEKVCSPGTYILQLRDIGGSSTTLDDWSLEPYTLVVTLDTSDIYETNNCNDNCSDAVEIEFGQTISATIADEFDEDFYKLEVPTEGVVKVQITGISDDYGMHSFLYSDVNCINEIEDASENNASFLNMYEKVCSPGTYILQLRDLGGSPTTLNDWSFEPYNLLVTLDTSDIYETNNCNDQQSSAFQLSEVCTDTFFAAINELNDQDYFQFDVSANSIINIDVKDVPSNINLRAELTNGTNTESTLGGNGDPISLTINNSQQSTYTLRLNDGGNNQFNESLYQLCIQILPIVSFTNIADTVLISDGALSLEGGIPNTGIYSGVGVNSSTGEFDPSIAGLGTHEITYTITDENGCSNSVIDLITVVQTTNTFSLSSYESIRVSPNPFSDIINIEVIGSPRKEIVLDIFNLSGSRVYSFKNQIANGNLEVDLSKYPAGLYLLRFKVDGLMHSTKIIKE